MGYTGKIVAIGAGISGLACAFRLKQLGVPCLVLEASERPGGVIATIRRDGYLFEMGPQFPRFPAALWRLVQELNLEQEFVAGDSKAKRYIFQNGSLHPAPFSPGGLIKTKLVGLKSKARILFEPLRHTRPPENEESLADFVERKFDREILENIVDPFVSTVFLGDTSKMGMESAFPALVEWERRSGSLLRGALSARKNRRNAPTLGDDSRSSSLAETFPSNGNGHANGRNLHVTDALPTLGSFRRGMATLPERLAEELREAIRYKVQVETVRPRDLNNGRCGAGWHLRLTDGQEITAEHLVIAVPAHVAGSLLEPSTPALARHLLAMEYAPICTVSSVYKRSEVQNTLNGFGFMIPRREDLHTVCTFWNSSLFAGRAPKDSVLLTSFSGRAADGAFAAMSDEECAQAVEQENAHILGISSPPLDRAVWRDARALPQYNVGHAKRVAEITNILRASPNLHLAGNYLRGRSIGECVAVAEQVAQNLCRRVREQSI
ncbi:MAG TPA: protoporphyrinogen oxidase [Candidatus Acidoferrum sp.]|nr:protoporphyrinogen oxidase [Candidatus Acidoferrum sp.]